MNPSDLSGFDPIVQDQLARIALDQDSRSRSQSSHHSAPSSQPPTHPQYHTYIHPRNMRYTQNRPFRAHAQPQQNVPGPDAFPPLGATTRPNPAPFTHVQQQDPHPEYSSQGASRAAQDFFNQARGGKPRGRGNRHDMQRQSTNPAHEFNQRSTPRDFSAHPPPPTSHRGQSDRRNMNRHRAIEQADYLNYLAHKLMTNMLSKDEIRAKHDFRKKLEALAKDISDQAPTSEQSHEPSQLKLQSYGSLSNSFGTSGCDVDLLLTIEKKSGEYVEITEKYKRDLEKALLDRGIGARLLTNTRIPIIRVCEKPSPELLKNLSEGRRQREIVEIAAQHAADEKDLRAPLPVLTTEQAEVQASIEFDASAHEVPLPPTPTIDHSKLEFTGNVGIQCDINFTNHVALYNTKMLWTYGQIDNRVRLMGIFIKNWAKARDINTPYRGTLSSYGYIQLVLHFLMNVASPPVIPNLQVMAQQATWAEEPIALFEGHDVRYFGDMKKIHEHMAHQERNRNSLGALLHHFFQYYTARDGFNWTQDVISIRTPGGILQKQEKGWTGAKWAGTKSNVRLRYLLAIEDPFEVDHNIARTVGHNGIKAIRDEFRRASNMVESIQRASAFQIEYTWFSIDPTTRSTIDGLSLIEPLQDRGDLLKKDAEYRKEQLRLLKQKLETEEEHAKQQALSGGADEYGIGGSHGMSVGGDTLPEIDALAEDQSRLIHDLNLQDKKVARMRGPQATYRTCQDDDDSSEDEDHMEAHSPQYVGEDTPADDSDKPEARPKAVTSSDIESDEWATARETPAMSTVNYVGPSDRAADFGQDENVQDQPNEEVILPQNDHVWDENQTFWEQQARMKTQDTQSVANNHSINTSWNARPQANPPVVKVSSPVRGWDLDLSNGKNAIAESGSDAALPMSPRTRRHMRNQSLSRLTNASTPSPPGYKDLRQQADKYQDSEYVGNFIKWSTNTVAGRWLLQRDKAIRAGRRVEYTAGDKGRLHAKFPYNPSMTQQELAEKNTTLEKYYKDSLYPRRSMEMETMDAKNRKVVVDMFEMTGDDSYHDTGTKKRAPTLDEIVSAALVGDGPCWNSKSGLTSWLEWRDRKAAHGSWDPRNALSKDVSELFARTSKTTIGEVMQMNWELDTFFGDLEYPRPQELSREEMDAAAAALRQAVQETKMHRATKSSGIDEYPADYSNKLLHETAICGDAETATMKESEKQPTQDEAMQFDEPMTQTASTPKTSMPVTSQPPMTDFNKKLLDIFNQDRGRFADARHPLDPKNQHEINARSMQVVKKLSEQLSQKAHSGDTEFIRAQRMAFYEKRQNIDNDVSDFVVCNDKACDYSEAKDDAVTGLLESFPSHSSQSSQSPLNQTNLANLQKELKSCDKPIQSGDELLALAMQYKPATTDSAAGEVVPNSLKPQAWRTGESWSDRFEDPRIIPIPRTFDYDFDAAHMKDLRNMLSGGNGCAREGQSAFRMENLEYGHHWGGGGAMAEECLAHSHRSSSNNSPDESSARTCDVHAILTELPGNVYEE